MFDGAGKEEIILTQICWCYSQVMYLRRWSWCSEHDGTPPLPPTDGAHWLAFCALQLANVLLPVCSVLNSDIFLSRTFFRVFQAQVTYQLTEGGVFLFEKLAVSQLAKKFPTYYATRVFINALTTARRLSVSQATAVMSRSIPILPFYELL